MSEPYDYTHEKLHAAITALIEGTGTIQERVLDAFEASHTVIDGPGKLATDFPPDARPYVRAILTRMTAKGEYDASARALSDEDAVQVARWYQELYFRMHALTKSDEALGGPLDPLD